MRLSELMAGFAGAGVIGKDVEIAGVTYDSRAVKPGDLFVAIPGLQADGRRFVRDAVGRGAAAVVVERGIEGLEVPQVLVGDSRACLAPLSDEFYSHPTASLSLAGVTGTNGKTTTSFLIESIFKAAGLTSGLMGTVECHIGDEVMPAVRTTPEASDLQESFRRMVDSGVKAAVIEVSSHALDLNRVDCCDFDAVVFTNISQDHLDYHPTIEDYFAAKSRLFQMANGVSVVNVDDPYGRRLADRLGDRCLRYSTKDKVEVYTTKAALLASGSDLEISTPLGTVEASIQLPGAFNVQNALAAVGAAVALRIPLDAIAMGLEALPGVPGRFERVPVGRAGGVVVDYAHTPDGLEKVLETARELVSAKLYCVFGCGGDRDKAKRAVMGEIAGRLSDLAIITSDNPRSEDPMAIIAQIESGIQRVPGAAYEIIPDRREAIKKAIAEAAEEDLVVIAGKGHETGQTFATGTVPFDDREVAREVAKELTACSK